MALVAASFAPAAMTASAATPTWIAGNGNGNWSTASNWSTGSVPAAGDNAYIDTSGATGVTVTYDFSGAITLDSVNADYTGTQSGGTNTLVISSDLAITADTETFGYNGSATVNQSDGTNTIATSEFNIFLGYAATGTGTYNLSGGSIVDNAVNYPEVVGFHGTGIFYQTGGSNNADTAGVVVGWYSGSTSAYTLSNGGSLSVSGGEAEYVGYIGAGTFTQTSGTNTLTSSYLVLGDNAGANGTYNLNGGSLSVSGGTVEYVGYSGAGTFTQTSGTNTTTDSGNIDIASNSGSTGTYSLSGGSLSISGDLFVGGSQNGAGGTGIFTVSGTGSAVVTSTVTVYNTTGNVFNLNGGSISAAAYDLSGNPSLLNWTAGSLQITTDVTFDPDAAGTTTSAMFGSALTLGNDQALEVQGNETLGGTGTFSLTLNAGSNNGVTGNVYLTSTGTITQNGGVLSYGRLYQQGGTINDELINLGTFDYQSGTFNARLFNENAVDFEANFTAGKGIVNGDQYAATLTLPAGITVTANGQGLNNASMGTITSTPTSILQIGGSFLNTSTQNTTFNLSTATVKFIGGVDHTVTWPGVDMGQTYAGYSDNFAIGTLELSSGDTLALGGAGAIYVSTLLLDGFEGSGESLTTFIADNISNAEPDTLLNIYYDPAQSGNAYLDDQTYALSDGGVLAPVPEPAGAAMLLVLTPAILRRRRHNTTR